MKTFNSDIIVVGTAEEIKAVEKSMRRAWSQYRSNIWPSHFDRPVFRRDSIYGIAIEPGDLHDVYYVVNESTICRGLVLGYFT